MSFRIDKQAEDERGKMIFISFNNKNFGFLETRKGYARGGHFRNIPQDLFLISGQAEYTDKNLETGKENTRIVSSPALIKVPPKTAVLIIALEDCLLVETLEEKDNSVNYPDFRKIVEDKMKK